MAQGRDDTSDIEADAEVMARIRAARAEIDAGDVLTAEELAELMASTRREREAEDG